VYDDKKKVEVLVQKSLQNLFLGLPIHSHTFSKFVHANSEYVQKLTKVFAKSMYPMKETQPHKKSFCLSFFFLLKKICAKFQHFYSQK
jgi:poly-beta-hydroxyalkanoate depolymerase